MGMRRKTLVPARDDDTNDPRRAIASPLNPPYGQRVLPVGFPPELPQPRPVRIEQECLLRGEGETDRLAVDKVAAAAFFDDE